MKLLIFPTPLDLIWAAIGLILTVIGTLLQLTLPSTLPWVGGYSFSFQVSGVLLTGCLGGSLAAVYAQVGYLILGLSGVPIFSYGGDWSYIQQPGFGYLLGFIPAAWLCGSLAFSPWTTANGAMDPKPKTELSSNSLRLKSAQSVLTRSSKAAPARFNSRARVKPLSLRGPNPKYSPSLGQLGLACLGGILAIHVTGIVCLFVQHSWNQELQQLLIRYSVYPLPGQCLVGLGVALVAVVYRRLTFY